MHRRISVIAIFAGVVIAAIATGSHALEEGCLSKVAVSLQPDTEAPLAGVAVLGDYAYVGGMSVGYNNQEDLGVRVVDLRDPAHPQLVARIPLRRYSRYDHTHGDAVVTSLSTSAFQGDIAVVLGAVPDTYSHKEHPQPYGVWDVTDPTHPEYLSIVDLGFVRSGRDGGDLSDKPFDSKAVAGRYFYAVYGTEASCLHIGSENQCNGPGDDTDTHVAVVDLADPRNPVVIGHWQDEARPLLMGLRLNRSATRAYVTAISPFPYGNLATEGHLFILDISDPTQPTQIGHFVMPVGGTASMYAAVPTADGTHVVLADGTWNGDRSGCGTLHILDVSDPAAIHVVSEFSIKESTERGCGQSHYFATDVAIRGTTVYSTWMTGGVRAVDITDPANPVEVGRFVGTKVSDVALLGDSHLVATVPWGTPMYILHDSEAPVVVSEPVVTAVVGGSAVVPDGPALDQNYPNPFNAQTVIRYALPAASRVRLSVHDLAGQTVATLAAGEQAPGGHVVRWDGTDDHGRELASGVYVYRLRVGERYEGSRKLLHMR